MGTGTPVPGGVMEEKSVWRCFFAWNDWKEEEWLGRMAAEGWHLLRVSPFLYRFRKGKPADLVFRLDYRSGFREDREEYLSLFRDAGWEHRGEMGGWQYFSTPRGSGKLPPEIYSDNPSRATKYKRLLLLIALLLLPQIHALHRFFLTRRTFSSPGDQALFAGMRVCAGFILGFMLYAFIRVGLLVVRLRKRGGPSFDRS